MTISITEQKWLQSQTAKIIANALQYAGTASSDNPKALIEAALQNYNDAHDSLDPDTKSIIFEMLSLAELAGIQLLESSKSVDDHDEESGEDSDEDSEDEMSDKELDNMIDNLSFEDYVNHAYEDDELAVIDPDTGERLDQEKKVDEQTNALNEVLSRMERVRARSRMAKTKTKRMAKEKIALKKRSSTEVINRRARRMAVKAMEKRLARNKPLESLSVPEKERIERIIARRKAAISRLAMKIVPHVRAIEKDRLQHPQFTQSSDK